MTTFRILVVDDEPDIRTVVERSLARDTELLVRSCGSAAEGLVLAADWLPDLILLDFMMPMMDGPTMLARLRRDTRTARIPVVFLTARAQSNEIGYVRALGANGIIPKPFEPAVLRKLVRDYLRVSSCGGWDERTIVTARVNSEAGISSGFSSEKLLSDDERAGYLHRLHLRALVLIDLRARLTSELDSRAVLEELRTAAHRIAGTAGLYGFDEVGSAASILEKSIAERSLGVANLRCIRTELEALIKTIEYAGTNKPSSNRAEFVCTEGSAA